DAHRAAAMLLAETDGRSAAVDHLRLTGERFPYNYPLRQLGIEWLRQDGPPVLEPAVRALLELHPVDAWARRELALTLSALGRHEEALAEMALARTLEPGNSITYSVLAGVCQGAGRRAQARDACREAIRLSVDNTYAIGSLMGLSETLAE